MGKQNVLVIGAGPAGLAAAYELQKQSDKYNVTGFEESEHFEGNSRTVNHDDNRMDMGGHRFFSKGPEVTAWWDELFLRQGTSAKGDILLKRSMMLNRVDRIQKAKTGSCHKETGYPESSSSRSSLIIRSP